MTKFDEGTLGMEKFCIQPHVASLGPAVFKLVAEGSSHSYLMLEVLEGFAPGKRARLGKHLVRQYNPDPMRDFQARYQGTLVLRCACRLTDEGFIEPSGEGRQL